MTYNPRIAGFLIRFPVFFRFLFATFALPLGDIRSVYFLANTVARFPLSAADIFFEGFDRISTIGFLVRPNSNRPPIAIMEGEKPRTTIDCNISVLRCFEVRITHAAISHITKTRNSAVNLGRPCLMVPPPDSHPLATK